jgi:flagellar biosynthesis component FlhA
MSKRTSVLLEEDVYKKLVEESLKRYGTVKALSKVLNELLRESIRGRDDIMRLICSEKVAKTSARDFEKLRRELSQRLET